MSAFEFARPSGQWAAEFVPGARDFQWWDVIQSKSLNGDLGGTWTPPTPIGVGQGGMGLNAASQILGGVTTRTGGRIKTANAPTLSSRGRTLTVPTMACTARLVFGTASRRYDYYVTKSASSRLGLSFANLPSEVVLDIPRRYLHQNALLQSVALNFAITARPASLPTTAMQIALLGHSYTGAAYNTVPVSGPQGAGLPSWQAAHVYGAGAYVVPSGQATNRGYYYWTAAGGTSAGGEPAWPTVVGNTVVDNTVTWKCIGRSGWLSTYQQTVDAYFANGAAQALGFDVDTSSTANLNTMDNESHSVSLAVLNLDPLAILTGLSITYAGITSLAFE